MGFDLQAMLLLISGEGPTDMGRLDGACFLPGPMACFVDQWVRDRIGYSLIEVEQQYPLTVHDKDGTVLGEYFADLFIDDRLIVELKACKALVPEHTAQLLGYLRTCKIEHGLLVNFGAPKFQIRKYALSAIEE
jgi:GxxExxY protein